MFPWHAKFEQINLAVESKDYQAALELIEETIKEANQCLIDPRFLVKELREQRKQIELLANEEIEQDLVDDPSAKQLAF